MNRQDGRRYPFPVSFREGRPLDDMVREFKRFVVDITLNRAGGNKTKTAELLGISRFSVINNLKDG